MVVGRNARMNLREDVVCERALLCFLVAGSSMVPGSLTDFENFWSKTNEPNDVPSRVLKETGPPSRGCLTVAS